MALADHDQICRIAATVFFDCVPLAVDPNLQLWENLRHLGYIYLVQVPDQSPATSITSSPSAQSDSKSISSNTPPPHPFSVGHVQMPMLFLYTYCRGSEGILSFASPGADGNTSHWQVWEEFNTAFLSLHTLLWRYTPYSSGPSPLDNFLGRPLWGGKPHMLPHGGIVDKDLMVTFPICSADSFSAFRLRNKWPEAQSKTSSPRTAFIHTSCMEEFQTPPDHKPL